MKTGNLRWRRWARWILPVLFIMLYHSTESWGQAPPPGALGPAPAPGAAAAAAPGGAAAAPAPAAAGPANAFWRLTFATLDQWSFVTHPYYQITGDSNFSNGVAATGGSIALGTGATDAKANSLTKLLHSLPPFGLEWGRSTTVFLPKAFSVGFDYFHFYQYDTQAARSGSVPPIETDTYLYNLALRFFAFDPTKPGINYYAGIGVGILDGTLRAKPYSNQSAQFINFSQNPYGSTRLGLEAKGDNFGFRYELMLVNADRVHLDKNPYPNGGNTRTIDFSGAIIRLAGFYEFD